MGGRPGARDPGGTLTPHLRPPRKMQHRNLVRLLGVILHQGLYIVMEHVSKVGTGPEVGAGGGQLGAVSPPDRLATTGQPGEFPPDAGPGPREHPPAPAVLPVSGAPGCREGVP